MAGALALALSLAGSSAAQELIWSRNYGGTYNESGYAGEQLPDGGFVAFGSTFSAGSGDHDMYLVRLDSLGESQWTRTFGGAGTEYGYDVCPTADGGFVMVGMTRSSGAGDGDIFLVKADSLGWEEWSATYGGAARDEGWAVCVDPDGGFVIAGVTYSTGAGESDLCLIRTDSLGTKLWQRNYGGVDYEWGVGLTVSDDGGLVIAGSTQSFGEGFSNVLVCKTSLAGDSLWARVHGGARADLGYAIESTLDGGFIIAGSSNSFSASGDIYALKLDVAGNLEWQNTYGGAQDDRAYAIRQNPDGGFVIAGTTESFGAGKIDMYALRLDRYGWEVWSDTYGGSESDFCRSLVTDERNNVILVGYSYSDSHGGSDLALLKVQGDILTDVTVEETPILPESFALGQNYPNPFNPRTTIPFSVSRASHVTLTVYNTLGQTVAVLFDAYTSAGEYRLQWDGTTTGGETLASGLYLYRLQGADFAASRKMVLLK